MRAVKIKKKRLLANRFFVIKIKFLIGIGNMLNYQISSANKFLFHALILGLSCILLGLSVSNYSKILDDKINFQFSQLSDHWQKSPILDIYEVSAETDCQQGYENLIEFQFQGIPSFCNC